MNTFAGIDFDDSTVLRFDIVDDVATMLVELSDGFGNRFCRLLRWTDVQQITVDDRLLEEEFHSNSDDGEVRYITQDDDRLGVLIDWPVYGESRRVASFYSFLFDVFDGSSAMNLVLAGDSAGKPLIDVIAAHLAQRPDVTLLDLSQPEAGGREFYADMTARAAHAILDGRAERGIFCCGTGIGVSISANKVPGIRAALTHDTYSAERAAKSNNAQVITMGARVIGPELAKAIVDTFLSSAFDPDGASAGNVQAIDSLDRRARTVGGRP